MSSEIGFYKFDVIRYVNFYPFAVISIKNFGWLCD